MDFSILAPTLERYGAPLIAELLDTAAGAVGGPLAGMAVKGVTDFVLSKLGTAFDVPSDDPAAIGQAVETAAQADPAGTATKLQAVQADHADLIQGAMAQAKIDEANTENARATEIAMVTNKSPYASVVVVLGAYNLILFAGVAGFLMLGHSISDPNANLIVGAIIGAYASTQAFWQGTSQISHTRTDQAIDYAHKAAPPSQRAGR